MASFGPRTAFEGRWQLVGRALFAVRTVYRAVRTTKPVTAVLGPQYRRSRDLIEIDITYRCNLGCFNCNRSVRQAPSAAQMSVAQIERFCAESRAQGKRWRRIRLLGGEPTLHPDLPRMLEILRAAFPSEETLIELATNGHGVANEVLARLPAWLSIDNSQKTGSEQPHFGAFNLAPADDPRHRLTSFRNGCQVTENCGMGLTPYGYYACAVAGGVDRVAGYGVARHALPGDDDTMEDQLERLCALCGRFSDGHFIPHNLRRPLHGEPKSVSWTRLYAAYHLRPPLLPRYGADPEQR